MIIGIDASRANRHLRSGTEWYSFYLIKEIAKLDALNQYILYTDRPLEPDLQNLTADLENDVLPRFDADGFQIIKSPHNNFKAKVLKWPFSFFWTQGRLSIEMLVARPDVLFVPAHVLPLIHPRRSIVTVHDVGFERNRAVYARSQMGPESGGYRKAVNFFVRLMTLGKYGANTLDYLSWSTIFSLKHAYKIITVSEFSKAEIKCVYQHILPAKAFRKIEVVYNGFDDGLYHLPPAPETPAGADYQQKCRAVLTKYDIKKPYLFYLGRIERKKNIPNLIEAFGLAKAQLGEMGLVLAGSASFGYDEVGYLVSEYGLDNSVIKTGWVEEADLPYLYGQASSFIFPSVYEGFGIPLIEAMACGIPVACSTAEAVEEVVDGAALTFDPQDKQAMADALVRIVADQQLRTELIRLGLERSQNFSWHQAAKKTLDLILT